MLNLFWKIFTNKKTVLPVSFFDTDQEVVIIGKKLESKVRKMFGGSLAIRQVAAGSDNSVEQELNALTNSYYDAERFGIHFVASPKHADMLLVSGPVSRNMVHALKVAYDCMPSPKIVVAVGDGAINGGIYKGSYATVDGVKNVIPVHFEIPGDPPSPKTILAALLTILEKIDTKKRVV